MVLGRGVRWLMAMTVEATVAGLLTYLIRDPLTGERLTLTRTEHTGLFLAGLFALGMIGCLLTKTTVMLSAVSKDEILLGGTRLHARPLRRLGRQQLSDVSKYRGYYVLRVGEETFHVNERTAKQLDRLGWLPLGAMKGFTPGSPLGNSKAISGPVGGPDGP